MTYLSVVLAILRVVGVKTRRESGVRKFISPARALPPRRRRILEMSCKQRCQQSGDVEASTSRAASKGKLTRLSLIARVQAREKQLRFLGFPTHAHFLSRMYSAPPAAHLVSFPFMTHFEASFACASALKDGSFFCSA